MRVILAGGTGFLGTALQQHLRLGGHEVQVMTRKPGNGIVWQPDGTVGPWAAALEGADAVINLAGAGIADTRWTAARKQVLRDSRILPTRSLANAIRQLPSARPALINASGIGYYGDRGSEVVTEATPAGSDFLARLCVEWEREADAIADITRVVILRNGLVMDAAGGALAKMLLPFRLALGGPLGSATQYLPWIHMDDWLALVVHLASNADARGPFNVTAPVPATNREFTRALGQAVHRPAVIPVPAFALRAALGELADTLLTGQRAVPKRAEDRGFTFRYRQIDSALRAAVA